MVLAVALVSFGVGLVLSWLLMRRARADLRRARPRARWTWEEWRSADPLGGRWAPPGFVVSSAATLVVLYGFGAPGWLRAALLGLLAGICLPPFVHGVSLLWRERREAARSR